VAPYAVPLDAMTLVVMDDANAPDPTIDHSLVPTYRADFASLRHARARADSGW
jgi:hypothetical protein